MAFAIILTPILWWLSRYSADQHHFNSAPHWFLWSWFSPSPDSTVEGYARQVKEHARLNDETAADLMATVQEREATVVEQQTVTITYTGQA